MKFLPLLSLLLLGGLAVSCKRKDPTPAEVATAQRQQGRTRTGSLQWFMTNLPGAYERVGQRDPKWDAPVKSALSLMAAARTGNAAPDWQRDASVLAQSALDQGCTDPLVRYVAVRYRVGTMRNADAETAQTLREIAGALEGSEYPASLKFYAAMRAAEALKAVLPEKNPPRDAMEQVHTLRRAALADLVTALEDKTTPETEVYTMSWELMQMVRQNEKQFPEFWGRLEPALRPWTKSSEFDLLHGWFYEGYAWQARGGGFANEVTPEGARLFEERLKQAEQSLQSAWRKNNTDTRIPAKMIEVCTGLGKDRAEMEQWFRRAMVTAPNNYEACRSKLHYLKPIWYGSPEAMLSFGRECVANTNWSGTVPLILVDAHDFLSGYRQESKAAKQAYWLQPEVWQDVRAAYEEFFRREPDAVGWHHNYAWYAYKCQAWDDLNEQLKLLGPVNYGYFGGQQVFAQMLADAKKHAKP